MAAQRYYYSDKIADFLSRGTNEIVGALTLALQNDINDVNRGIGSVHDDLIADC